jgi:RNA polymerase sigma factor (sigma-70 family)
LSGITGLRHVLGEGVKVDADLGRYDVDLLLAARTGDVSAFAELYRRHSRAVLRYAWGRLGRQDSAEEVMQDTFVVAWAKRATAPIVDLSLLPYLLSVCRNHVANELRRQQRSRAVPFTDTIAAPQHDDTLAWMQIELEQLSPIDRQLCELCLGQGVSYRDAARIVDSTETAVGKRIQRARLHLRTGLGDQE